MQAAMQLWTGEQAMPDAKEYAHKYARRCGEKAQEHILQPIQQDSILCRLIALWQSHMTCSAWSAVRQTY